MNGEFEKERRAMTDSQIRGRGVRDPLVLAAIDNNPAPSLRSRRPVEQRLRRQRLPIGQGQTISQPYIVAYMTEALGLTGGEKVLEIGTRVRYIKRRSWPR